MAFGNENYGGSNFGISDSARFLRIQSAATTQIAGEATFSAAAHTPGVTTMGTFAGTIVGSWGISKSITTLGARGSFEISGFIAMPATVSTMDAFAYVAWDGQSAPDTTWTTQTVN
jgi:hypothetical protein